MTSAIPIAESESSARAVSDAGAMLSWDCGVEVRSMEDIEWLSGYIAKATQVEIEGGERRSKPR